MRISRIVYVAFLLMMAAPMWAQQSGKNVMVDYNSPKKYIIGGVKVEGTEHVSQQQIIQIMYMPDEESLYDFLENYSS